MAKTQIFSHDVKDGQVWRDDLNVTRVGQAVTRKIIQGTNISLSSTGADAGTGDVTVSLVSNPSVTSITAGNVSISANTIASTNTDGNINLIPNGSGKVGIGTTSPSYKLHVRDSANPRIVSDYAGSVQAGIQATSSVGQFGTITSHPLVFVLGDSEKARFTTTGYFCIGSTSASNSSTLNVVNTNTFGRINVTGVSSRYTHADIVLQTGSIDYPAFRGTGIYTQNQGNNVTWYFGNPYGYSDSFVINRKTGTGIQNITADYAGSGVSNFLKILNNGHMGIGVSVPTSIIHTVASGAKTDHYIGNLLTNVATSSTASKTKTGLSVESTGTWNGTSAINRGLHVNVSGGTVNYSAIFEGGNVGIGTTSPAYILDVLQNQDGATRLSIKNATSGTAAQTMLQIENNAGNVVQVGLTSSAYTGTGAAAGEGYIQTNTGSMFIRAIGTNNYVRLGTNSGEKMRILDSGRIAVNRTDANYTVDVNGDINCNGTYRHEGTPGTSGTLQLYDTDNNIWQFTFAGGILTGMEFI